MNELLRQLYPGDVEDLVSEIDALIDKYALASKNNRTLSHEDCILITYGDAFQKSEEAPLRTLKKIADVYLKGKVSAIHLLPCFPYTSDDGFSVTEYYEIDPKLGGWEDIKQLNQYFDLMFDAVVNHASKSSEWFQAFLDEEEKYAEYFIQGDPKLDYSRVVRPRALPLFHPYKKTNGETVFIWTTFGEDQVDLNYKNPRVFLHILDVLLFYVSKGAKFIRLDAIAFLWKKMGTSCIHLKETHLVIQAYRKILDSIGTQTILITETNVPHNENISYFGDGSNEAHMIYNFTLPPILALTVLKEDVSFLIQWARKISLPSDQTCFFNFTASHDGVGVRPLKGIVADEEIEFLASKTIEHGGFVSYKDNGDGTRSPYELNCNYLSLLSHPETCENLRKKRFLITQSVMLCMPGVPGIYYHSLIGSENDKEGALLSGINRRINREKIETHDLEELLKNEDSFRAQIFFEFSQMLHKRSSESVFNPFGRADFHQIGKIFIVERSFEDQQLFAIHNFSGTKQSMKPLCAYPEDILGTGIQLRENWKIEPYEYAWLKVKK